MYSLEGLLHVLKTETSFKLEVLFAVPIMIAIYVAPFAFVSKLVLVVTMVLIMIVELLNSAIENVVDMVTKEYHPLAKSAKDIAATAVLFSVLLHLGCWVMVLAHEFELF